jgi:CHRD domain/Calx-beta domain
VAVGLPSRTGVGTSVRKLLRIVGASGAIAAVITAAGVARAELPSGGDRTQTHAIAVGVRLPSLTISSTRVDEDAGTNVAAFIVRLTRASTRSVRVRYATASGTATANDYTAVRGVLTFAPRQRSKQLAVKIAPDDDPEDEEFFYVRLSRPQNARITRAQGRGTIAPSDLPSAFTVVALMDGRQQREGNPTATGSARLTFVPAAGTLSYSVSVQGIGGQPTETHLHPGGPTDDGLGVLANLESPTDNGTVSRTTTFSRLTMLQIREHPEQFYVQVHSTNYFTGAIRGQLQHGTNALWLGTA